ncbi:MAG: thioredoxin family protein [Saprospiraceae bacterium]|nr:thioredoxin family protein [Saprospiraceae bacterium]
MLRFVLISLLLTGLLTSLIAKESPFINNTMDIKGAKEKASLEGKLIFLDFHAKWCTPCTWMDQTTFADEQIINILQEEYVALKIDIDQKEGFEIKNQFDVKYLPTLLIFNSEGIMIERIEKTVTPRILKEILLRHNEPVNKKVISHSANTAPTMQVPTESNPAEMKLSPEEEIAFQKEPKNQKVYKLQVGVFEKYESAEIFIQKLNQLFTEPVTVRNDFIQQKIVFRVFIGQFDELEEAQKFKDILKTENQMDAIVI